MGLSYMKCAHPGCEEVRELTKAFCAGHQKQNDDQLDALRAFEREVLERAARVMCPICKEGERVFEGAWGLWQHQDAHTMAYSICEAGPIRALALPDEELWKWQSRITK